MLTYKLISNQQDFEQFKQLVADSGLPIQDLNYQKQTLISFFDKNAFIATAGLEIYGADALLRSVAVIKERQHNGIGSLILDQLQPVLQEKKIKTLYLLTETAKDFFLKRGFELIERKNVPQSVQSSAEFSHICPASASVMMRKITV